MRHLTALLILTVLFGSCSKKTIQYPPYQTNKIPVPPTYEQLDAWAAHPDKNDPADRIAGSGYFVPQNPLPDVDVFFVHPTIYSGKHNPEWPWQGNVKDHDLNEKVDNSTIKFQASVFNGSTHVYAPRYRQAHLDVFRMNNVAVKDTALQLAYTDVKRAFEYYLKNENQGRPFILASHSQGTLHAAKLVLEFIDGKPLQKQFVAGYLIGIGLRDTLFSSIKPCNSPTETGCWISWNTFENGYYPPNHKEAFAESLSTNPLTWKTDSIYAPNNLNEGAVLRNYNKVYRNLSDAQNHQGLLWITKPKFFGSVFYRSKRYHIADYNLFYGNIRSNVKARIEAYLSSSNNASH